MRTNEKGNYRRHLLPLLWMTESEYAGEITSQNPSPSSALSASHPNNQCDPALALSCKSRMNVNDNPRTRREKRIIYLRVGLPRSAHRRPVAGEGSRVALGEISWHQHPGTSAAGGRWLITVSSVIGRKARILQTSHSSSTCERRIPY